MRAALLVGFLLLICPAVDGGEPLRMKVSPTTVMAPGFLTVRVNVEAAPENRMLQVVAESADFYRSSEIQLDGARANPLSVFEFRNLPSGLYEVTSVLVGVNGRRASVGQFANVQPALGR